MYKISIIEKAGDSSKVVDEWVYAEEQRNEAIQRARKETDWRNSTARASVSYDWVETEINGVDMSKEWTDKYEEKAAALKVAADVMKDAYTGAVNLLKDEGFDDDVIAKLMRFTQNANMSVLTLEEQDACSADVIAELGIDLDPRVLTNLCQTSEELRDEYNKVLKA